MRSTFKILLYINRNKIKADGTTTVMCRITIDGKNSSLSTGIYCTPENWNSKKAKTNDDKADKYLLKLRQRIEQTYDELLKSQGIVSAELLKNTVVGVNTTPQHLLQAGAIERERLRLRYIEINSTSTYRQSKTTHSNLRDFIQSRRMDDIMFTDITHEFGESFKLFLKRDLGYKPSHVNHCLTWLNRLIYIAVDQDVLRCNPLEEVEYEKKEPPKLLHITREELKQIMSIALPYEKQELIRRAFIFSCMTALAYVDIYELYPYHIAKTVAGRKYIRTNRRKTAVEAFIPLHPVAEQILSLYNTTDDSKPIFPLPVRDKVWYDLQEIAFLAGLKGGLSYHQSRHTFGTLTLSAGIPIESISKMMGHTNISSTQVYAKVTDQKISDDMDRLIERRKQNNN